MGAKQDHYLQSMNIVEDICMLADDSLMPVLNRFSYHLFELNKELDRVSSVSTLGKIDQFLKSSVNGIVREFSLRQNDISRIDVEIQSGLDDLEKWNKLLEVLPTSLEIVSYFSWSGPIHVIFDMDGLKITGDILGNQDIEKHRPVIYRLSRRLFANKSLMTFRIDKSFGSDCSKLTMFVDLSHSEKSCYSIDLTETCGFHLGFSNIFEKYRFSPSLANVGKHTCVEITKNITLKTYSGIPEGVDWCQSTREIIHFSFLFRPLSIIIPKRGKVFPLGVFNRSGDTGSDVPERAGQDVGMHGQNFHYIDFFSLVCT